MRIVSWNMNYWQTKAATRIAAWHYLREGIRADVALLQECMPPIGVSAAFSPIDPE